MDKDYLGIYVHIPFCSKKCLYCDFASYDNQFDKEELYIRNLVKEIENFNKEKYIVDSIFIGGGTPSVLSVESILKIGEALNKFDFDKNIEFSVECNPCSINEEKLIAMKSIGVNRISFGLQSYNDNILKSIGRVHNVEMFDKAYKTARDIGIENINVDIMFNLPNQTFEEFKSTLKSVTELEPEHLSVYGLIIEEDTPFYEMVEKKQIDMPDEDVDRDMYELCETYLSERGYNKYEISNYCKDGYECRHNVKYWTREEYIGFGLNSHSMIGNVRFCNTGNLDEYLKEDFYEKYCYIEKEDVSVQQQIEEYIFLGLRLMDGINIKSLEEKYDVSFNELYGELIEKLEKEKLICVNGDNMKLTKMGVNLSNYVMSQFLM